MSGYYIFFYVPKEHCEVVKEAMFQAGAGKMGNYDSCAWQTEGVGQFRANDGSSPFIGEVGKVERVEEYKVEIYCQEQFLQDAIKALKEVHPYEEVAYGVIKLAKI